MAPPPNPIMALWGRMSATALRLEGPRQDARVSSPRLAMAPESLTGPNAGLTEMLIPAGYVTTVYDPVFSLSSTRRRYVSTPSRADHGSRAGSALFPRVSRRTRQRGCAVEDSVGL